jgi:hypothetical protein
MATSTTKYAHGTSVTQRFPFGLYVSARLLCSDGKVRPTVRLAETADSFYSVPAAVKVNGKTVSGYLTMESGTAKFIASSHGRNAALLPGLNVG